MKLPVVFAVLTAMCWGLYGPILAKARTTEGPFRPYVAIGVAYLVIAIFGGLAGMKYRGDSFAFTGSGITWGLIAGALGAFGALFLTLCMFNGGNKVPQAMMPIVFGGAVSVAALYAVATIKTEHGTSPMLWVGIALMLLSAVIITMNTPAETPPGPKPPAGSTHAATPPRASTDAEAS
jgi:hypothetical protein